MSPLHKWPGLNRHCHHVRCCLRYPCALSIPRLSPVDCYILVATVEDNSSLDGCRISKCCIPMLPIVLDDDVVVIYQCGKHKVVMSHPVGSSTLQWTIPDSTAGRSTMVFLVHADIFFAPIQIQVSRFFKFKFQVDSNKSSKVFQI